MKRKVLPILLASSMVAASIPTNIFASDIDNHWAKATIQKWQDQGLINGYPDGSFKPDNSITRAEFVTLLNKVTGKNSTSAISFSDVKEGDWFYNAVAIAVAAGYTSGYEDGTFKPNANVTRAEAAVFVAKAMNLSDGYADNFADASAIPSWAKSFVGAAVAAGYVKGYEDGTFKPNDNLTRAEAVTMLNNALGKTEQVSQNEQPQQEQQPQQDEAKKDFKPVGSSSGGGGGSSSSVNVIESVSDLKDAFKKGGTYTLKKDITADNVKITDCSTKKLTLDLGKYDIKNLEIDTNDAARIVFQDGGEKDKGATINTLTINAPNAEIENAAKIEKLNVKAVKESTFKQLDAIIKMIISGKGHIVCEKPVQNIIVDAKESSDNVVIEAPSVDKLELKSKADITITETVKEVKIETAEEVKLVVEEKIETITVKSSSKVTVTTTTIGKLTTEGEGNKITVGKPDGGKTEITNVNINGNTTLDGSANIGKVDKVEGVDFEDNATTEKWTVTFNTNGGTPIAKKKVENGKKVDKPENPTKAGYTFSKWTTDAAGANVFDFNTPITSNITLYAQWTPNQSSESGYIKSAELTGTNNTEVKITFDQIPTSVTEFKLEFPAIESSTPAEYTVNKSQIADKSFTKAIKDIANEIKDRLVNAIQIAKVIVTPYEGQTPINADKKELTFTGVSIKPFKATATEGGATFTATTSGAEFTLTGDFNGIAKADCKIEVEEEVSSNRNRALTEVVDANFEKFEVSGDKQSVTIGIKKDGGYESANQLKVKLSLKNTDGIKESDKLIIVDKNEVITLNKAQQTTAEE